MILNRDELTSIMIFVIVKAEIPDLFSQLKLISEFTSTDIQEATKGYPLSEIYMLIQTTVQWLSSVDIQKLQADRSYLLNAKIEMRDDGFTRYDRIRFSEVGDRFDPFQVTVQHHAKNSYIGDNSYLGGFTVGGGALSSYPKKSVNIAGSQGKHLY